MDNNRLYEIGKKQALADASRYTNGLEYVDPEYRSDKDVVMAAVKRHGPQLKFASDSMKDNYSIVMTAVGNQKFGDSVLCYASDRLRNDEDIVMKAVERKGVELGGASDRLRKDPEICAIAINQDPMAIQYVHYDNPKYNELAMKAIQASPYAMKMLDERARNDMSLVKAAIQKVPDCKEYVSDAVKHVMEERKRTDVWKDASLAR